MTDINSRSSVLAVVEESTEGTPVAPSANTEYVRLQDDADVSPSFETLENAEKTSTIGVAKPIVGTENPTMSFSHYLRHSGSEGSKPDFSRLLKACIGTETVAGAEYNTVASSTTSVIKVDSGEGQYFPRGTPMLIKDGTNGYNIRPSHSVSTDDITMGFNLPTAPGTGVELGQSVLYSPADSGHVSLALWHYLGNGGGRELISGARVVSLDIQADAGQLVNMSFNLEGIGYYFNPIEISSSNNKLDFDEDGSTELTATIPSAWYKDPHELATAITTAIAATAAGDTHTVTYSDSTGKFTWASDGGTLNLRWNTGTNTANTAGAAIGFSVAANDTGSTSYTSDNAITLVAPHTPSYDSADPLVGKHFEVLIGDATDTTSFAPSSVSINLGTPKTSKPDLSAQSGVGGSLISSREVTVNVSGYLSQYDAQKFKRFRSNEETRFLFNGGTKTGGNWDAGKCFSVYIPTATINSFSLPERDGLVGIDFSLRAYVNSSGDGEFYLGFV